jgi:hypothetical protein
LTRIWTVRSPVATAGSAASVTLPV